MILSFDVEHKCTPGTGTAGIRQEDVLTKEVVGLIVPKIRELEHNAFDCTPYGQAFNMEKINRNIGNILKKAKIFFIYASEKELRSLLNQNHKMNS